MFKHRFANLAYFSAALLTSGNLVAATQVITERGDDNSADHANWIAPKLTHTGALLEK